jgi:hypothetical protein
MGMIWTHVQEWLWIMSISEAVRVVSVADFTGKQNSYISHHKIRPKKYSMQCLNLLLQPQIIQITDHLNHMHMTDASNLNVYHTWLDKMRLLHVLG